MSYHTRSSFDTKRFSPKDYIFVKMCLNLNGFYNHYFYWLVCFAYYIKQNLKLKTTISCIDECKNITVHMFRSVYSRVHFAVITKIGFDY